MRLGAVILPELPWSEAAGMWRDAEALGFSHAWTYDHLAWRSLRDGPWFAAIPVLTAASTVTASLRLGTLVASLNFRHPVPLAREVLALDDISEGRLDLGLGAGGEGWDATMLGRAAWSPAERSARFAEFVALLDRLLSEREVTQSGEYYSAVEPRLNPVDGARAVGEQLARLREACGAAGRDFETLRCLVLTGRALDAAMSSEQEFADAIGAYGEVGVTDLVVHWPRAEEPFRADRALFERIIAANVGC